MDRIMARGNDESKRMLEVRKSFDLSQRELAKRVGYTSQLISMVEKKKASLSFTLSREIERKLGVSASWLLTGEGPMMATGKENNPYENIADMLKCFPSLEKMVRYVSSQMELKDWIALDNICSKFLLNDDEKI